MDRFSKAAQPHGRPAECHCRLGHFCSTVVAGMSALYASVMVGAWRSTVFHLSSIRLFIHFVREWIHDGCVEVDLLEVQSARMDTDTQQARGVVGNVGCEPVHCARHCKLCASAWLAGLERFKSALAPAFRGRVRARLAIVRCRPACGRFRAGALGVQVASLRCWL